MSSRNGDRIILVIDDEDDIRQVASRMLQLEGYTVYQAPDAETGLRLMEGTGAIDLLLLDLTLPGMDGWDLFHKMRKSPVLSTIPTIIFSATATASRQKEAFEMGAVDYLVKPVSSALLRETVARALK